MKFITKETCLIFMKDYLKSKSVAPFVIVLFASIIFGSYVKKPVVIIVVAVFLFVLSIIYAIKIINISKSIQSADFYLVEDVVVSFKKRLPVFLTSGGFYVGSRIGLKLNYVYKFKKYGKCVIQRAKNQLKFEIPLHKEIEITHLEVERLSSESSNKGDMFYLLIFEKNGKPKIIKPFYKYYFEIEREDFNFIDGKYYIKQ